jgi:hypothetical protein
MNGWENESVAEKKKAEEKISGLDFRLQTSDFRLQTSDF